MNMKKGRLLIVSGLLIAACAALVFAAQTSTEENKAIQQALKDKGYDPGPIDGVVGPKTRAAVKKFQSDNDLQATGQLDEKTLDKLNVESKSATGHMGESGKEVGRGAKRMGRAVKRGEVVEGAKEFGKGVGRGGKEVGKGVKQAVTPKKEEEKDKP